ncbi:hypothetical protein [Jatrophihabitans sp.]|uniref:hypothetical protein n=1 Tax=Jatrophihabitans sp. TaxID=1932789 RepID=UPI002BBE77C8|nr:hypothetical protein [Jatrophihabitans sp.]
MTLPHAVSSQERLWARAHSRATLLADVSTTMSGSLNVRRSALRLIELLRPAFADWVLLGLPDPDGKAATVGPVLLAVQHPGGSLAEPAGEPLPLRPGDVLLCVTGPTGTGDPAPDRAALLALLHRYRGTSAQVLVEAIEQHVVERLGDHQDFLAVAVECRW